jgi:curved DNA-binding protein CbpA
LFLEYNYYKILGLESTAGVVEIKRTYRKLAFKYHPDKNSDSKAKEFFQLLTEAYTTLSDAEKRFFYDKKNNFNQTFEESVKIHPRTRKSRRTKSENKVYNFHNENQKISLPPKFARVILFSTGLFFGLFMMVFPILQSIEYALSPTLILVFLGFILTVDSIAGLTGYRTMIFFELFRVIKNWFKVDLQRK